MAKTLEQLNLPANLKYTAEHIWVRAEGDELVIGISDFAQDQLGEVVYIDLPSEGDSIASGAEFGGVESVKSVNTLYMPVAGTIAAVNTALEDNPTLLNASCYEEGWIARITPEDADAVSALLSADAYKAGLND